MSGEGGAPLVLVVDDYDDSRQMYADFLTFSGFRVEQARDGVEALEKAAALLPAVILMDLSLPRVDGWECARRLKRDSRTRQILVVALTGHALSGDEARALEAGCDAFIAKPCLPDEVARRVQALLDARAKGT
ncbi:MAG TPA: response regulator [Thermodesulfobacteriota bacterium]|nr:response regulator [Thermodesulfobacteriota bacterium]